MKLAKGQFCASEPKMMGSKIIFICQNCGSQRSKWEGRCTDCGQWNTFQEESPPEQPLKESQKGWSIGDDFQVVSSNQILEKIKSNSFSSGFSELDRVLGGGIVPGGLILLGGDPGIGKSTLLLQMTGKCAKKQKKTLYISAEESVQQSALRTQRLGIFEDKLEIGSQSNLDQIIAFAEKTNPHCLVVDSIQTVFTPQIFSAPGTVSQVRECTSRLMSLAKNKNIAVFLVGHVTKEGELAGPKVLEHIVDTVLSFEGSTNHQYRLLRTLKNRFGSTHELGVFEMSSSGLQDVSNPSQMFLQDRLNTAVGSAVMASLEGTRPVLCEVQALSVRSYTTLPRRTAIGIDPNRLFLILAVLDKFLRYDFSRKDVFVNVVGGLRFKETASDLSVCAALLSSEASSPLPHASCFFGEIGLTGEIRSVPFPDLRLKEGQKLGFQHFFLPKASWPQLEKMSLPLLKKTNPQGKQSQIKIHCLNHITGLKEALSQVRDSS